MAEEIIMPKMGMGMETGTLLRWLKAPGEPVSAGEPVAEIETDKTVVELDAPINGTLGPPLVDTGDTVPVGVPLCVVYAPGESPGDGTGVAEPTSNSPSKSSSAQRAAAQIPVDRARLTPSARRRARELGLNVAQVAQNFPPGRVTREQVEAWHASQIKSESRSTAPSAVPATYMPDARPGGIRRPLSRMRAAIARRMVESLQSTAQLTLTTDADVSALVSLRESLVDPFAEEFQLRPSFTAFVARAMIKAIPQVPDINSRWGEDGITLLPDVDLGVAVALEEGLIVPVVREAQQLDFLSLNRRIDDVIRRARQGALAADEAGGSTITLTNLGMYDIDAFTPILNPPEVAVLGVGRIRPVPIPSGDQWGMGYAMTLSLTIDHRVVDGAPGAQYLQRVAALLSQPELLLV